MGNKRQIDGDAGGGNGYFVGILRRPRLEFTPSAVLMNMCVMQGKPAPRSHRLPYRQHVQLGASHGKRHRSVLSRCPHCGSIAGCLCAYVASLYCFYRHMHAHHFSSCVAGG